MSDNTEPFAPRPEMVTWDASMALRADATDGQIEARATWLFIEGNVWRDAVTKHVAREFAAACVAEAYQIGVEEAQSEILGRLDAALRQALQKDTGHA